MNIFQFRDELIDTYKAFSRSFTKIASSDIELKVREQCDDLKRFWPEPLLQINPTYKQTQTVSDYCQRGRLHPLCNTIFRNQEGESLHLFSHQDQAIDLAQSKKSYVVTTGTGSGKSLSFFIPIIDQILKDKKPDEKPRTRAIILYPMNALANSQKEEIDKFLKGKNLSPQITVARYTGQETAAERSELHANPPDILLTNYMMLELVLMRHDDRVLIDNCKDLQFLVLDELHTYRGRQGSDVAMLVRRLRSQLESRDSDMICIGTSATMSSVGSREAQNTVVAKFASEIFGITIKPNQVIAETLVRVTNPKNPPSAQKEDLHTIVLESAEAAKPITDYSEFRNNALAIWLEDNLSITKEMNRAMPLSVQTVISRLATDANVSSDIAERALKNFLSQFGTDQTLKMPNGRSPFAFKLHQFISGPGRVYVTLQKPGNRVVTLDGQTYIADQEKKGNKLPLFEAHFCRECGQEYIPVWFVKNGKTITKVEPRSIDDTGDNNADNFGYLCPITSSQAYQGQVEDLPDDWLDPKKNSKVRPARKKDVPQFITLSTQGTVADTGTQFWAFTGKFKLCVNCLQTYTARGRDKHRLIGLSGEGRSSATTVLSLQILRQLYNMPRNPEDKYDFRKLLGFSDNRQDTALQAGHFNDFLNQIILRGGLVCALRKAQQPLRLPDLVDSICHVFHFNDNHDADAMTELLVSPETTQGRLLSQALSALRFSLSYRLLKDLRDQNLYTCPSLEKLGLMYITYEGLKELCSDHQAFAPNSVLRALDSDKRQQLFEAFLSEVRRRQCISTRYFLAKEQEVARDMEHKLLNYRWRLASLGIASRRKTQIESDCSAFVIDNNDFKAWPDGQSVRFTERSSLIKYLNKLPLWQDVKDTLPESVTMDRKAMQRVVCDMTAHLCKAGILRQTKTKYGSYYQLDQASILWNFPKPTEANSQNYHHRLYLDVADSLDNQDMSLFEFEAQEHTAQVSSQERELLEMRFRASKDDVTKWEETEPGKPFRRLPVLYCSPTMELGIDISALNYVYMRNIPPTAANYTQRAGRAGRSGQQALSLSYCAAMSPHDQWFFRHPEDMVQGVVKEPTLDLSNESLIKRHLHSVWMTAACLNLPKTVPLLLDLKQSGYPVREDLYAQLTDPRLTQKAVRLGRKVLSQVKMDLADQTWFTETYLEQTMQQAAHEFSRSFEGWRNLYKASLEQIELANKTIERPGVPIEELRIAKRRHDDSVIQKTLLEKNVITSTNNDFYTYRYLANQGFLPGYNFPAMPLLAWVPDNDKKGNDNKSTMLSRARFLGLSEFGPLNVIYHRGRIYRIDRLKINVHEDTSTDSNQLPTMAVNVCPHCGYAHVIDTGTIFNQCENCGAALSPDTVIRGLYKVSMVETSEVERISIEDENRRSQGFETQTLYRFARSHTGQSLKESATIEGNGSSLATLTYAAAATVWRVNLGWKRRVNQRTKGFVINPITGYWLNEGPDADVAPQNEDKVQVNSAQQTIVPFVTDTRNILLFEPKLGDIPPDERLITMATLQAALKRAIEQTYQIESSEIFVEPLPNTAERRMLLIYEAGEGGSGVLRNIIKNPDAISRIAFTALELMHYDIGHGQEFTVNNLDSYDTETDCINGCYRCLLTYFNQPEHVLINRHDRHALEFLVALAHSNSLKLHNKRQTYCDSPIEHFKQWAAKNGYAIPDCIPKTIKSNGMTYDGAYSALRCCVSFKPVKDDEIKTLEDSGWQIIDLSDETRWFDIMDAHPELT